MRNNQTALLLLFPPYLIVHLQNGMQPIHFATMSGHTDITETLVDDYGVDVHSKDAVSMYTICDHKSIYYLL